MPEPSKALPGGAHRHAPADVIGRIQRHGTARLAERLTRSGCAQVSTSRWTVALLMRATVSAGPISFKDAGACQTTVAGAGVETGLTTVLQAQSQPKWSCTESQRKPPASKIMQTNLCS